MSAELQVEFIFLALPAIFLKSYRPPAFFEAYDKGPFAGLLLCAFVQEMGDLTSA